MKQFAINVSLIVFSVVFSILTIELFLVIDDWRPNPDSFRNEVLLNGTKYTFLESREAIDRTKSAILIVGDSFTAGVACADNRNFPSVFTKAAEKVEVDLHAVNLGVDSTEPVLYLDRVRNFFLEKGPTKGLIISLYANDIEMQCRDCSYLGEFLETEILTQHGERKLLSSCAACDGSSFTPTGPTSLLRRLHWRLSRISYTYRMLRESAVRVGLNTGVLDFGWGRSAFPMYWNDLEGFRFKFLEGVLGLIKHEADQFGVPMMVVIYPDVQHLSAESVYFAIYRKVGNALSENLGLTVYSGFDAFLGNPAATKDMSFSLSDHHPNCEAHEIFGKWVFDKWMENYEPAFSKFGSAGRNETE